LEIDCTKVPEGIFHQEKEQKEYSLKQSMSSSTLVSTLLGFSPFAGIQD
jgi:hypothetical protein